LVAGVIEVRDQDIAGLEWSALGEPVGNEGDAIRVNVSIGRHRRNRCVRLGIQPGNDGPLLDSRLEYAAFMLMSADQGGTQDAVGQVTQLTAAEQLT
jgi:hypothetical protein